MTCSRSDTPPTTAPAKSSRVLKVDGVMGKDTVKALQKVLGVTVDGVLGKDTVKALQKWLNKKLSK